MHILKVVNPWFWSKFLNIFQVFFSVEETLVLWFDDVVFLKGCFLDHENDILLLSENLHILKGVNPWFWAEVPNIYRTYFCLKETLVLSFDDLVFSKGGFLDHKNDILLLSKNLHILKGVNPWFWSEVPNIYRTYFSGKETLVLSFDDVFFLKGGFLDHKNDIFLQLKKSAYLEEVDAFFRWKIANIFVAYFSLQ